MLEEKRVLPKSPSLLPSPMKASSLYISAMSYGALSLNAVMTLNRALGFLQSRAPLGA
jgi:glutamate synthase domain-containing protein 2